MKHTLAALTLLATGALAETHGELSDTLDKMLIAYLADPRIDTAEINAADQSVTLTLTDGSELISYPDNLHNILGLEADPSQHQTIVANFVDTLLTDTLASYAAGDEPLDLTTVLPVIRDANFGVGLSGDVPLSEPFFAGLSVYMVADQENTVSYLVPSALDDLNIDQAALMERALRNLEARQPRPSIEGDGFYQIIGDGFYESSYMLVPSLWQFVDQQIGTPVAAIPARDILVFVDGDTPEAIALLRQILADNAGQFSHPLTDQLFRWTGDGWEPLN